MSGCSIFIPMSIYPYQILIYHVDILVDIYYKYVAKNLFTGPQREKINAKKLGIPEKEKKNV